MLIERAKSIDAGIIRLKHLRQHAQSLGSFRTRLDQLSMPVEVLGRAAVCAVLFRRHDLKMPFDPGQLAALREHLRGLGNRFTADPGSIVEPSDDLRHKFFNPLKRLAERSEAELMAIWQIHVESKLRANPQLMGVLERIPSFQPHIRQIRALVSGAHNLSTTLPVDEAPFRSIDRIAEQISQAWTRLPIGADDGEASRFLVAAATPGGVSLRDMTPEVLAWIDENNLRDAFKVVLG